MTIDLDALREAWIKHFETTLASWPDQAVADVAEQLADHPEVSREQLVELLQVAFSALVVHVAKQEALRRSRT
jgi:hypothetical protein